MNALFTTLSGRSNTAYSFGLTEVLIGRDSADEVVEMAMGVLVHRPASRAIDPVISVIRREPADVRICLFTSCLFESRSNASSATSVARLRLQLQAGH